VDSSDSGLAVRHRWLRACDTLPRSRPGGGSDRRPLPVPTLSGNPSSARVGLTDRFHSKSYRIFTETAIDLQPRQIDEPKPCAAELVTAHSDRPHRERG
jgi:hypothetical protein